MAVLTQTVTTETAINWEELAQKIKDNTSGLKVGDIITEKTLDGEEMDLVVVDMGPGWARFESKDCLPVEVAYNQNNRNAGGFADSDVKRYRFQALRKRERHQRSFLQDWKSKGNRHRRGYEAPLSPDRSQWIRIDRLRLGKRLRHCRRLYCWRLWLYCGGQNGQGKELGHKVRNRPDDPELGEVQKIHGTEN